MRKGFLIMLAVVLVAVMAAPATAGTDITGFYRAKAYVTNFNGYLGSNNFGTGGHFTGVQGPMDKAPTRAYVDQRVRLKFASGEENVKAVAFFEIDSVWGDASNGRNTGGNLGGDAANLETKNAYLWFKVPNTSLDVTVGLQGQSDSYAGVFMFATDMAGIFVNGKMDPVTYRLGWAKWSENASLDKSNDRTFYLAEGKFSPAKDVKLGLNFYYLQDDTPKVSSGFVSKIYMPGADVTFGAGPATINAFAFYQFGKAADFTSSTSDIKINGFAADVRADLNAGPGKAFVEALYISGDDGNSSTKYKSIVDAGYTNSLYTRTDMTILFNNIDIIGTVGGLYGSSMNNRDNGLMHFAAGFNMKIGDKMAGKVGVGYLAASKLDVSHAAYQKKPMGTEFNASLNYNLMKGLDVGVVGAYALIGDYFKPSASTDADNAYDMHARVNYAF